MPLRTLRSVVSTIDTSTARPPRKTVDPHYLTPEHQAWRAEVMRRSGWRCADPNHDPGKPRAGIRLFADHVVELRDGGAALDPANGMARCGACHSRKTAAERARR